MKKELIILSGFLGCGKTTFLHAFLARCSGRKTAVILNDFGEIPVDGALLTRWGSGATLVEIGGGSVFCSCLSDKLVTTMFDVAKLDVDIVIIEASGMSDPSAIDRMLKLAGLDALYEHTTTLCLFDPVKSLKLARVLAVIPRQLASATLAVVTKADHCSQEELAAAEAFIQQCEPNLPFVRSYMGEPQLPADGALPSRSGASFSFGLNTPENRLDSFAIVASTVPVEELIRHFDDERILRVKGFVHAADGTWFVSDTGKGYTLEQCEASDDPRVPVTVICTTGTGEAIRQQLESIATFA